MAGQGTSTRDEYIKVKKEETRISGGEKEIENVTLKGVKNR